MKWKKEENWEKVAATVVIIQINTKTYAEGATPPTGLKTVMISLLVVGGYI